MKEPICVSKARELGTVEGLKVVLAWLKKNDIPEPELAKAIDIYSQAHNLNISYFEAVELIRNDYDLCSLAKELGLCSEEECPLKKSPIDRMIMDIDPNSIIVNYSTGVVRFKINGKTEQIPLDKLITVRESKKGPYVYYNAKLIFQIYVRTYMEPCDPSYLDKEGILKFIEFLKRNGLIVKDESEEGIIEDLFIEFLEGVQFRKFEEISEKGGLPNRVFIDESQKLMYIKAREVYDYIQQDTGYGYKTILSALGPYLVRKHGRTTAVVQVKEVFKKRHSYRFLVFNLDAVKLLYTSITGKDLEIEYEKDNEEVKEVLEKLAEGSDESVVIEEYCEDGDTTSNDVERDLRERALGYLKSRIGEDVTTIEVADYLGVDEKTAENILASLRDDGEIIGSEKFGEWTYIG